MRRPLRLPLFAALLLSGCGAELDSPGEALRIFASTVDPAYLNEDYTFDFVVEGGLAPYNFEVREGRLPPGLTLENGTINGTPTERGNFDFSLQVSDANLSQAVEDFTLEVATAPPARLVLNVPPTEISEPVRIPITVQEARDLQALRTQITWDDAAFNLVAGSVRPSQTSVALLQQASAGQLSVDAVFLGPSLNGDAELFSFELEPTEPSTLSLSARTEYRSRTGTHGFSSTEDSADVTSEDTPDLEDGSSLDGNDIDAPTVPEDEDQLDVPNPEDGGGI